MWEVDASENIYLCVYAFLHLVKLSLSLCLPLHNLLYSLQNSQLLLLCVSLSGSPFLRFLSTYLYLPLNQPLQSTHDSKLLQLFIFLYLCVRLRFSLSCQRCIIMCFNAIWWQRLDRISPQLSFYHCFTLCVFTFHRFNVSIKWWQRLDTVFPQLNSCYRFSWCPRFYISYHTLSIPHLH